MRYEAGEDGERRLVEMRVREMRRGPDIEPREGPEPLPAVENVPRGEERSARRAREHHASAPPADTLPPTPLPPPIIEMSGRD